VIRNRRILLGLSQQQFGDLIGVTYQQVHMYEKGTNRIAASRLLAICEALDHWPVAEALAGIGAPSPRSTPACASGWRPPRCSPVLVRARRPAVLRLLCGLVAEAEDGEPRGQSMTAAPEASPLRAVLEAKRRAGHRARSRERARRACGPRG
jgi:transcriptional regulator with XRE-family HTH domain